MRKIILDENKYTLDASAKTITFTEDITLQHLLLITNIEDNLIIYNFACDGFGGSFSGRVLTLDYDVTAMSDTDNLSVIVYTESDSTDTKQTELLQSISTQIECSQEIINQLKELNVFVKALA